MAVTPLNPGETWGTQRQKINDNDSALQADIDGLAADKADTSYVDSQDADLQTQIDTINTTLPDKADTSYVDSQDATLQANIDGKLAQSSVDGVSLDTLTSPGLYHASNITDPPGTETTLFVLVSEAGSLITQLAVDLNSIHTRQYDGSAWSAWVNFAGTSMLQQLEVRIQQLEAQIQTLLEA